MHPISKYIQNFNLHLVFVGNEYFRRVLLANLKPIIYGKEALLLSDLLENIKRLCEKNGIEESISTITRTLKNKIIDTFPG